MEKKRRKQPSRRATRPTGTTPGEGQTPDEWVSETARAAKSGKKRPVGPTGEVREEEYGGPRDEEGLRASEDSDTG